MRSDLFSSLLSDLLDPICKSEFPQWGSGYRFHAGSKPATVLCGSDCDCLFTWHVNACDKRVFEGWGVSRKRSLGHLRNSTNLGHSNPKNQTQGILGVAM